MSELAKQSTYKQEVYSEKLVETFCINMKKLTSRYKKWLVARSRRSRKKFKLQKRNKRHVVDAWFGDEVEKILSLNSPILPPSIICFEKNLIGSMNFLAGCRDRLISINNPKLVSEQNWFIEPKKPGGLKRIKNYVDFSKIEYLSTSAAVVLAAEFDRVRTIIGGVPPTINLDRWPDQVFKKLFELGFFEIVGLVANLGDKINTDGDNRSMKILTGANATELDKACREITNLCSFIDDHDSMTDEVSLALNNALSEAMINVSKHAYDESHKFRYQHVNKWWVTASANRTNRMLTVVIYDQGASIPVTFSRKEFSQIVRDFLKRALIMAPKFDFQNDSVYIEGAMKPGHTRTDQKHQGLGLPEMKDLVDICGVGSLAIYSRGGVVKYVPREPMFSASRQCSIGGTLIEWTLQLPGGQNNEQ